MSLYRGIKVIREEGCTGLDFILDHPNLPKRYRISAYMHKSLIYPDLWYGNIIRFDYKLRQEERLLGKPRQTRYPGKLFDWICEHLIEYVPTKRNQQ